MVLTTSSRYRLMPPGNPLAAWGVICGIAGFCVPGLGGAAALVLGVVGLVRSRRTLGGRGAAVAAILLGLFSLVCYGLLSYRLFVTPAH